jgi:alpha-glucuronidase
VKRSSGIQIAMGALAAWNSLLVLPVLGAQKTAAAFIRIAVADKAGKAQAAIVVGDAASESSRFAAMGLQKYVRASSGTELEIITARQSPSRPAQEALILVGGPAHNLAVREAADTRLTTFGGLKPDGFVIKTRRLRNRPVLVVGGNGDASTMYAVYELVEQLGVTFRLVGDLVGPMQSCWGKERPCAG